jgi:hypothetical protein
LSSRIAVGVFLTALALSHCGNDETETARVRERVRALMSLQQPGVTIRITDWSELRIRPGENLPIECSSCIVDLSDTTLEIKSNDASLVFTCPPTGLNSSTAIGYSCFPPPPPGVPSSGGGEAVLQWDTAYVFQCKDTKSASTAAELLNQLLESERARN